MAAIDDLTVAYEEEGVETVKQLDKKVLSKGAWATLMFKYQDWNKTTQSYGPPKFTIRRYQKRNEVYLLKSKFTISSADQAQKIIEALADWIKEE